MRFEIQPGGVVIRDTKPGQHATLHVNGRRLTFRGDLSSFNDREARYEWAFEGSVDDGENAVFETSDRKLHGTIRHRSWHFELRPSLIFFHDETPGQDATLHVNGKKFLMRGDLSSFSDWNKSYTWAFEGAVQDGDRVFFATSDRKVDGVVYGGRVVSVGRAFGPYQAIEQILAPPHPRVRPRPIPMPRPR